METSPNYEDLASYGALCLAPEALQQITDNDHMAKLAMLGVMGTISSQAEAIDEREQKERAQAETTEEREQKERAQYLSTHDELTGLLNRRGLMEQGEKMLSLSPNTAVIFLDADKFKTVNDDHGHDVGDELLKEIAKTILENVRDTDLVCRLGGDEFVVVFDTTPRPDHDTELSTYERVNIVLERIQNSLAAKLEGTALDGKGVGISGGFAIFDPELHRSLADLMQQADGKLYENKQDRRHPEDSTDD